MKTDSMMNSLAQLLETYAMGDDAINESDTVVTAINPIAAEMHFTLEGNDGTVRDFTITETACSIRRNGTEVYIMWHTLTNAELRQAISKIVKSCTNADDVNRRAKDELGYPFRIAVNYSERNSNGQYHSMFMAAAKDGETLT